MTVFIVQTTAKLSDGTPKYAYIETDHNGVAELLSDLRGGPVLCQKLQAHANRDTGKMDVTARMEYAIGIGLIAAIEMASKPFVNV